MVLESKPIERIKAILILQWLSFKKSWRSNSFLATESLFLFNHILFLFETSLPYFPVFSLHLVVKPILSE